MEIFNQIIPGHLLHALGWTVVHSLWQGLLIALLLGLFLYRQRAGAARRRYLAGFVALGAALGAALVTFFVLLKNGGPSLLPADVGETGLFLSTENPGFSFAERLNENMPLVVLGWLAGMAFFLLKMLGGLLYVQRLKHRHLSAVPPAWQGILEKLSAQLGLTVAVRLSASALVKVPVVVGWLKPMVLLPVGAVNHLAPAQVEAILAHELAHIARYDYLLNLLQSLIETVFYFSPAVWWISANIRTERENCCDDLAVQLCGNPLDYARSLVALQEMHQASPAFALSFASGKKQLLGRVQRILKQSPKNANVMEKISVTGLLLAAVFMLSMTHFNTAPENFDLDDLDDQLFGKTIFIDTLPKGNVHIQRNEDGEELEVKLKDGKIVFLEVDGEEIPEEEYTEWEEVVEEVIADVPPPPAPPVPNRWRQGQEPAAPKVPRAPRFDAAPVPPAPPAPPRVQRIVTERDGKKTIILIEGEPGSEPVEIEVEGGRKGDIIINGEPVEMMDDGTGVVLLESISEPGPGNHFSWHPGEEGEVPFHFFEGEGDQMVFVLPEGEMEHLGVMHRLEEEVIRDQLRAVEEQMHELRSSELHELRNDDEVKTHFEELKEQAEQLRLEAEERRQHQLLEFQARSEAMHQEVERVRAEQRQAVQEMREHQREMMREKREKARQRQRSRKAM